MSIRGDPEERKRERDVKEKENEREKREVHVLEPIPQEYYSILTLFPAPNPLISAVSPASSSKYWPRGVEAFAASLLSFNPDPNWRTATKTPKPTVTRVRRALMTARTIL